MTAFPQEASYFSMYKKSKIEVTELNKTYSEKDLIYPFDEKVVISGMSVSGNIFFEGNENSLVRIILIDVEKNEYLVFESYPMIADSNEISFDNICEETSLLDSVIPYAMKLIIVNANLTLKTIELSKEYISQEEKTELETLKADIKDNQVRIKSEKINLYNKENNLYWCAGITDLALKNFAIKKTFFGNSDDFISNGLEYYTSGIFMTEQPNVSSSTYSQQTSAYVSSFDWRNRHGRNWMTSVKHQSSGGGCWAFTAVGVVEAFVNLYYNQKIDIDLSEQDVISCSKAGTNLEGGAYHKAIDYVASTGVVNESCFPFANADLPCSKKCAIPTEKIKVSGRAPEGAFGISGNVDSIKKYLIHKGPLASGFGNTIYGHAMPLVGFHEIKAGDTIKYVSHTSYLDSIIRPGSPLIGQTYWIYKNSYGIGAGNGGYLYILFDKLNEMLPCCYIQPPVTSLNYTDDDIICEDKDGDGYYYWGIGPKPASCPSWAPDEPDGDDSDPYLGPMDEYGNCAIITPLAIYGPFTLCATATYTLGNNSFQASSWSVTSGFTVVDTGANWATVTACPNGQFGELTAMVNGVPISILIQACNWANGFIFGPDAIVTAPGSGNGFVPVSQAEYKVLNLPSGATVSWQFGSGLTTCLSLNPPNLNLNPICVQLGESVDDCRAALLRVTVTFNDKCPINFEKAISIGYTPNANFIGSRRHEDTVTWGRSEYFFLDTLTYNGIIPNTLNLPNGILQGEWKKTTEVLFRNHSAPTYLGITSCQLQASQFNNGLARIEVRLQNTCGWSNWKVIEYEPGRHCLGIGDPIPCPPCIKIIYSPNPVNNELTIEFIELPDTDEPVEYTVRLLDNFGNIPRQTRFRYRHRDGKPRPVKFNTSPLSPGTYYLHIEGGGEIVREQIIVTR
ncbi:MAG: hypothetical protein FWE63_06175 [Bacteroidales bacterium]|nr:hypothetical protein [Bacteroidales bacterium]